MFTVQSNNNNNKTSVLPLQLADTQWFQHTDFWQLFSSVTQASCYWLLLLLLRTSQHWNKTQYNENTKTV